MPNRRVNAVSFTKMKQEPVLADGLLAVDRDDGGPQRRVAAAFGRLADEAGQIGDRYRLAEGTKAGELAAREGAPGAATITGGIDPGSTAATGYAGVPGGAAQPASGDLTARGRRIRDGLIARGLTPMQAAAAVGHARQESSLNAAGPDGDSGTSSGLFQWRNERRAALQSFAGAAGKDWRGEDAQLDFFVHELKTREKTAWTHLQSARTLDEATAALMHFERPQGYSIRNPRGGHGWANRLANASWASQLGGDAPAIALAPEPQKTGAAAAIDRQITPESVAPPSVTPIAVERGKAGGFRPTGGMTIGERAYDVAGTRTYLQQLDATMRADVDAVYDRFKDDPVQLDQAFRALRTVHMEDHVYPEIAGDYDEQYGKLTMPYVRQAREDMDTRVKQQNLAGFMERAQDLETRAAQAAERFTGENAAEAVQNNLSAINAGYDDAVAHGLITAPQAVKNKAEAARRVSVAFYSKQGRDLMDPDAVDALRTKLREDFGKGELPGVDAQGLEEIDQTLTQQAAQTSARGKAAAKAYGERADDMATAYARGRAVDWGEVGRFLLDAGAAPGGQEIVQAAMSRMSLGKRLAGSSVEDADKIAGELEKDPAAIANGSAAFARREADHAGTLFRKDPIGYGVRQGLIEDGPAIDPTADPQNLGTALAARERAVEALRESGAEYDGVGLFRPEEASAFARLWREGTPEQIRTFTDRFVTVAPETYRATLEQPDVKKAVVAASTSSDPERNFAAMQQIDALAAGSGLGEVDRMFNADTADRLQDWQALSRYYTPEEARDWLKRRNDPRWREQIQPRLTEGRKKARETTVETVASNLGAGGWFGGATAPIDGVTQRAMKSDYDAIYADRYAATGDAGAAEEQAAERMKANGWGASSALGGRIMFQPPERYYPAIANSSDWIREQLAEDVKAHGGAIDTVTLIADQKTLSQIQKRQPPSWQIRIVDPETGFDDVIRDAKGNPLSWSPDARKAGGSSMDRAKAARKAAADLVRDQTTGADRDRALDDYLAGPLGVQGRP